MDRVEKICDLIIAKGIRKKYFINARLEMAKRPDVILKMEKAGFVLLMLGVESAHDKTLKSMQKGFDTAMIRKYFEILSKSTMLLHGYFILGNIGESHHEMEQIFPFASSLGLDTIALSTLRVGPYSGLDELVKASPGYHLDPDGKVYSDECSLNTLQELRRDIYRRFFSPSRILGIAKKSIQMGALSFIPGLIPRVPGIAVNLVKHRIKRKRQIRLKRERVIQELKDQLEK